METRYEEQQEHELKSQDRECIEELILFKKHHTTAEYVRYCRHKCIKGIITSHHVRRIIWYDILMLTSTHHFKEKEKEKEKDEEEEEGNQLPERIPTLCEMMLSRCKEDATREKCNKKLSFVTSLEEKKNLNELETVNDKFHKNKLVLSSHQRRRSVSLPSRLQSTRPAENEEFTQLNKEEYKNDNNTSTRRLHNLRRCASFTSSLRPCVSHSSELYKQKENCLCALPDNCQVRVLEADINRSLWNLYTETTLRDAKRKELKNVILRLLTYNYYKEKETVKNVEKYLKEKEHNEEKEEELQLQNHFYYYQGLHEMVGFVLYIFNPHTEEEKKRACEVCNQLIRRHWKVFTNKSLIHSQALLYALHSLICKEDKQLGDALEQSGVGPESHYAVSWLITWYCHSVEDIPLLTRLFDYFIAFQCCTTNKEKNSDGDRKEYEEFGVVFFTAALMLHAKSNILKWVDEETRECINEANVITCDDSKRTYSKRKESCKMENKKSSQQKVKVDSVMLMARVYSKLVALPRRILSSSNQESQQEQQVFSETVSILISNAENLKRKHLNTVLHAQEVYLHQNANIKKGVLAHPNTRNAALRRLWHLLPREWRNFVLVHHRKWKSSAWSSRTKWVVIGSLVVIAFALVWQYKQREEKTQH